MAAWTVGIDLGATKVALGLVDPQGHILARCRFPTDAESGPEGVVERIASCFHDLTASIPKGDRLVGIGICSPGPLDHRSGILIDPPNLRGWRNVPLRQMLCTRLNLPVYLEHDAKAAGYGEFLYGAGRGATDMVYIVVGTGVGAAIILDGKLYRGQRNSAGEVGHITIDPAGDPCPCGSVGCVETFVSGPGLARAYRRGLEAAHVLPAGLSSLDDISGETVAKMAERRDPLALQVMARAGEALGTAVASLAMILDVDLYVIGSSVAKAGDLLLQPAREAVWRHSFNSVARHVRIVPSALADDGPILGCSSLVLQELEHPTRLGEEASC